MRVVLFLILILFFCGCFEDPIVTEAMSKKDPELCRELEKESEQERCFGRVAEAAGDKNMCQQYLRKNQNRLDDCMSTVGSKTGDISACEQVADDRKKMSCYMGVGKKNNDASVCDKINDGNIGYRDSCYLDVATSTADPTICEKMEKGYHNYVSCYTQIAVKKSEPELCAKIKDGFPKDNCYSDVAASTGWQNVCANIKDSKTRKVCDSRVTGNPMGCEGLLGLDLDDCIYASAEKGGIVSECNKILASQKRKDCIGKAAKNAGKPELCKDLEGTYLQNCINDASIAGQSTTGCRSLDAVGRRNTCVNAVALTSLNLEDCDSISVSRMVDECKTEVMRERKKQGLEDKDFGERVGEFIGDLFETGPDLSTNSTTTTTQPSSGDGGLWLFDILGGIF